MKSYFTSQSIKNTMIQSEDGGGVYFTEDAKYIFGNKLPEELEKLNKENFNRSIDLNPNTNSSFIGLTNSDSNPINLDLANNNIESLSLKDVVNQTPQSPLSNFDLPDDEDRYNNSAWYNATEENSDDGTGFEGELTEAQIQEQLSRLDTSDPYYGIWFSATEEDGQDGTGFEGEFTDEQMKEYLNKLDNLKY